MWLFGLDEGWTERGCTLDDQINVNQEHVQTITCTESGCNIENTQFSTCIHCESHLGERCDDILDPKPFSKQCQGIYSHNDRGCFTMIKGMIKYVRTFERISDWMVFILFSIFQMKQYIEVVSKI